MKPITNPAARISLIVFLAFVCWTGVFGLAGLLGLGLIYVFDLPFHGWTYPFGYGLLAFWLVIAGIFLVFVFTKMVYFMERGP